MAKPGLSKLRQRLQAIHSEMGQLLPAFVGREPLRGRKEESHAEAAEKTREVAEKRSEDRSPRSSTRLREGDEAPLWRA